MAELGRPRSNTVGALDIDLGLPPQSPLPRPAKADNLPPSFELPPTSFRKKRGIVSQSKLDRRIEKRASAANATSDFDPMMSSSLPSDFTALLDAMGRERGMGMPSYIGRDIGGDVEMDLKIDGEDSLLGSHSRYSDSSTDGTASELSSAESDVEDDDEDYVYKPEGNLAKDFSFHYSFKSQVAQQVDTREEDIVSSSDDLELGRKAKHGMSANRHSTDESENSSGSNNSFPDYDESDDDSSDSSDDVPVSASFRAQSKAPLFSTSPLLGATLEKLRNNDPFNKDGNEFDEPPEFTLDVS